jgi:hypothetical protein
MKRKYIGEDVVIKLVLRLEDSSDWLRQLIVSGCDRDPNDVIQDLERALIAFKSAAKRFPSGQVRSLH